MTLERYSSLSKCRTSITQSNIKHAFNRIYDLRCISDHRQSCILFTCRWAMIDIWTRLVILAIIRTIVSLQEVIPYFWKVKLTRVVQLLIASMELLLFLMRIKTVLYRFALQHSISPHITSPLIPKFSLQKESSGMAQSWPLAVPNSWKKYFGGFHLHTYTNLNCSKVQWSDSGLSA